jgi:hypothetical protein
VQLQLSLERVCRSCNCILKEAFLFLPLSD